MMGMSAWVHWAGWFITTLIIASISVVTMTIILVYGQIFLKTNAWIVFILLETYAISIITMSFAISVFFSKAKIAASCAGLLYFLMYLPFIFIQINTDVSAAVQAILSLSSTTAFGICANFITQYEQAGLGLQWNNISGDSNVCTDFSFLQAYLMIVYDIFIYAAIAWYIDNVFPGEFGVPKGYLFFLNRDYWCGAVSILEPAVMGDEPDDDDPLLDTEFSVPASSVGIRIKSITKIYDLEKKCFSKTSGRKALDKVSLDMNMGEVTALLGNNGAGKTTLMSILTGLFPPTRGKAWVNGIDISTGMDTIQRSLGVCPQHNTLFDWLTVEEHLIFCGRVCGVPSEALRASIDELLASLHLEDKRHVLSSKLSGGMKRKLSVAMAFCGNPKIIILVSFEFATVSNLLSLCRTNPPPGKIRLRGETRGT